MIEANMKAQIQKYEEMCLNGHVALNTFLYDGWLLKFSEGYTGRANSVSVFYPSSMPFTDKVPFCEQMYKQQGLPCQFVTIHHKKFTKNRHYPLFKEIQM